MSELRKKAAAQRKETAEKAKAVKSTSKTVQSPNQIDCSFEVAKKLFGKTDKVVCPVYPENMSLTREKCLAFHDFKDMVDLVEMIVNKQLFSTADYTYLDVVMDYVRGQIQGLGQKDQFLGEDNKNLANRWDSLLSSGLRSPSHKHTNPFRKYRSKNPSIKRFLDSDILKTIENEVVYNSKLTKSIKINTDLFKLISMLFYDRISEYKRKSKNDITYPELLIIPSEEGNDYWIDGFGEFFTKCLVVYIKSQVITPEVSELVLVLDQDLTKLEEIVNEFINKQLSPKLENNSPDFSLSDF